MSKFTPDFSVRPTSTIRETVACIDLNQKGIALVLDEAGGLVNTVTDGDVRRALLAGDDLDSLVSVLLARKAALRKYPVPVTAPLGSDRVELLTLMHDRDVRQVPLVDANGRVAELVTLEELMPTVALPLDAVIMAGGRGTRLQPLTEDLPKPMLPVGDRPLMEHIVDQLRQAGIRRVSVATHYKAEKIREHFGDGRAFGVELGYLNEDRPLGTAGSLSMLAESDQPLLVINGDILTQIDFRAMLAYHREHAADLTIAVRKYEMQVPYGVIEIDGSMVSRVTEKPQLRFFVNAGIYLLEPGLHRWIPANETFNMTDLVQRLIEAGRPVASFPVHEYWLDIGQHQDYLQAQQDIHLRKVGR